MHQSGMRHAFHLYGMSLKQGKKALIAAFFVSGMNVWRSNLYVDFSSGEPIPMLRLVFKDNCGGCFSFKGSEFRLRSEFYETNVAPTECVQCADMVSNAVPIPSYCIKKKIKG